jgi:hypothetical protein
MVAMKPWHPETEKPFAPDPRSQTPLKTPITGPISFVGETRRSSAVNRRREREHKKKRKRSI